VVKLVHSNECCGRAVRWESRVCECWVHKCLLCGAVSYVDCGREYETHWDDFETACWEMT